jgi:hypothetical protein
LIYIFFGGEYEQRWPVAVFEAPEGVHVDYAAFLHALGVPPFPIWKGDVKQWDLERTRWNLDRDRVFALKGITDAESAHRQWLENHPQVKSLPFESWD